MAQDKGVLFTVDLEGIYDSLHDEQRGNTQIPLESFEWLCDLLDEHEIKAVFYSVDHLRFLVDQDTHILRTHGKYHKKHEVADREPYANLGLTGGFWFRLLPLWFIKWNIKRRGFFYIHLHDIEEDHPILKNKLLNWKRHAGLKTARRKLERLLMEVHFRDADSRSFR